MRWLSIVFLAAVEATSNSRAALPSRLVLLLDGVPYQEVKALQGADSDAEGTGKTSRQAFRDGYFPASRLIATFPSISDISWTEIMGNDPPPGYQRTYFRADLASEVSSNGVAGLLEYEEQMNWHLEGNFRRTMSYSAPMRTFKYELNQVIEGFLQSNKKETPYYYALFQGTDIAQHSWGNVRTMLCMLDDRIEKLRAIYRKREGRELEILILSDHGNDGAGRAKRIGIKSFLRKHGYRVAKTIGKPNDVVVPTAGIESWVEIHNLPSETSNLLQLLSQLKGVDLVTARHPEQANRFIIRNSAGEQAEIQRKGNSFKYEMESGDPLEYRGVVSALASKGALDASGFATGNDWMKQTLNHRYPLALERIVRGHTRVAQNPATILLSLQHRYVHSGWLLKRSLDFAKSGGTHGSLDNISSTGVLLSNFAPTIDTSSSRVAALFEGFKGRQDYRADADKVPRPIEEKSSASSRLLSSASKAATGKAALQ